jgi:hypothetical protein
MDFSEALTALKEGRKVRRAAWSGAGYNLHVILVPELTVQLQGDEATVMPQLLVMDGDSGMLRPFSGANWDLLADDWELAE